MTALLEKPRLRYEVIHSQGRTRALLVPARRGQIVWTAWVSRAKAQIVHIIPVYCGSMTCCGTRTGSHWVTAWGVPEMPPDARMCWRCMYAYGAELIRDETGRWAAPFPMYGRRRITTTP